MIDDLKITAWTNPIADEADRPQRSASAMKGIFDSNSNELKTAFNALIDALLAATGTEEIGGAAMPDVDAGTLKSQLEALRGLIDERIASISIGTVTTGAAGSSAEATITGTLPNVQLNLTIPKGDTGIPTDPHALTHYTGGVDELTPSDIGAAAETHASQHASGGDDPITLMFLDTAITNFDDYTASGAEETALFADGYIKKGSATLSGVLATTFLDVVFSYADRTGGQIGGAAAYDGGVYVYSKGTDNITIPLIVGWN